MKENLGSVRDDITYPKEVKGFEGERKRNGLGT